MRAGELCKREVVILHKDKTLLEAAKLMRDLHVGSVVVVDEKDGVRVPIGILTDRDLVVEIIAKELNPADFLISDVVITSLMSISENEDTYGIIEKMRERGVRRLPVVDSGGHLLGILSLDDMLEFISEELEMLSRVFSQEEQVEKAVRT